MLYAGYVLIDVKKATHWRWNAAVKVPLDFYMKNVQSSGLATKETRIVMSVGKKLPIYL